MASLLMAQHHLESSFEHVVQLLYLFAGRQGSRLADHERILVLQVCNGKAPCMCTQSIGATDPIAVEENSDLVDARCYVQTIYYETSALMM
jgi:hypothetical protein